jgi:hypothetical protein
MAGFHFNGALFRTAAVCHRTLKVVIGKPERQIKRVPVLELLCEAEGLYRGWKHEKWEYAGLHAIHLEVNLLKHQSKGLYARRKVTYQQSISAVDELLNLVEVWAEAAGRERYHPERTNCSGL